MKRFVPLSFVLAVAACSGPAPESNTELQHGDVIPGRYIVQLEPSAVPASFAPGDLTAIRAVADDLLLVAPFERDQVYGTAIRGFSITATDEDAALLAADPRVLRVEPDRFVALGNGNGNGKGKPGGGGSAGQVTPWGITRIGGAGDGTGKTAWVIDTGIDFDHPDLNVDVARSRTFVSKTSSADDQNGHGTHVAGTIAAKNNTIGVVGVAAGATVVPVRVLDRRGSGAYSWIIAGVDYVASAGSPGDVANMSLGGPASSALDDAVRNAAGNGIVFALASGNESTDASTRSPARVNAPNVYTISASDSSDEWAWFSNYGSPVDYAAPGVSILSTWKGGGLDTISGTSMASPHVAGILLLGSIHADGTVSGDPDGSPDPIAHR